MKRRLGRYLPALASLVVIATLAIWVRQQADSVGAAIALLHEHAQARPWIVALVFALRPFVLFPVSLLVISCGMLFEFPLAYLYGWLGQTLSGVTGYAAVRWLVPPGEEADGIAARWRQRLERNAFESVLMMRVIGLPYDLVNYGCAWLRTPTPAYVIATAIGIIPASIALVSIGDSINLEALSGGIGQLPLDELFDARQLLFSAALVIASLLLARAVRRRSAAQESVSGP